MGFKKTFNRIAGVLLSGVMAATAAVFPQTQSIPTVDAADTQMRDISTMDLVRDMGIGINLGNTFESTVNWDAAENWIEKWGDGTPNAYETAWGSPTITRDMIDGYAKEGFGVVRVPVAWSNMMSKDGQYTISPAYKARVKQIIDWVLEDGMYAIVNLHWDGGWLEKYPTDPSFCMAKYTAIWNQLCAEFKDYGDHLMFEAQNEELYWNDVWNQWGGDTHNDTNKAKVYQWTYEVNQKFVDIVRQSGGNNAKRHLLISGYNTDVNLTCDPMFKMPTDPAGRCAVSVHYYIPSTFAILEEDADWGKSAYTWGSTQEVAELTGNMDRLKSTFVDKGIPVIIGEYGCPTKNKDANSVRNYLTSVCREAYNRKMCPVLWDTPGGHYDRGGTNQLNDRQLHDNYMQIVGDNVPSGPSTTQPAVTTAATTQPAVTTTTTTATAQAAPSGTLPSSYPGHARPVENMRDISTKDLVKDMGIGINIGNTFDACGDWIAQYSDGSVSAYETAWGSPIITKDMIEGYAKEGFGVLRIPVAWSNRMVQDGNYIIDQEWMARITQIVDWTIDSGMYAIVNIHWDNGWVNTFPENRDECMKRFERMWIQISDNFKNYGDKLMFEAQNEELGWESLYNRWNPQFNDKEGSYNLANQINQKFVDVIRSSGGNNPKRHLLISGYNTGFDTTCDPLFKMPSDPMNRCAVSVHYYTPAGFAILEEDADWGKASSTWGTDAEIQELKSNMEMMKTNFIDKGIPVIVGEYGCPKKNKDPESVRKFLKTVCQEAYSRELCPILWDTPGAEDSEPHYNRKTCRMSDQQLRAAFNEICPPKGTDHGAPVRPAKGDINRDGSVTVADAVMLTQYLLGKNVSMNLSDADVCTDGKINVFDLVALKRMLINK